MKETKKATPTTGNGDDLSALEGEVPFLVDGVFNIVEYREELRRLSGRPELPTAHGTLAGPTADSVQSFEGCSVVLRHVSDPFGVGP